MDELRRSYHDRIAALRNETIAIVGDAARSVESVTAAVLDPSLAPPLVVNAADAAARAGSVEAQVLELLALQAPVARDLRLILAALRIAQIGELCLGLGRTLAARVGRTEAVLTPTLRALLYEVAAETVERLDEANGAWVVLDEQRATAVIDATRSRDLQRRLLAALLGLTAVPVEAAVDLGMAARVYERLTDHAAEIAGRVIFAVTGAPPAEAYVDG